MAKIPFNIKFRPQIESGEYKVETEEGSPARIICWDSPIDKERPIIAIVFDDQIEQYKADGHYDNDYETSNYDLFVIIPEPEFSEFEKGYMHIVHKMKPEDFNDEGLKIAKEEAAELLELAKNEILRSDKWIIGNDALRLTYERGKAEALKDLPEVDIVTEYNERFDSDPVYGKLVNRNAGIAIARHFAEWGVIYLNTRKEE